MNNKEDFAKEHRTVKWVPVTWGTPSKEVAKVLARTSDGFVEEGIYDRRNKTWHRPDGTRLDNITHWSLIPDSMPVKKIV